jgi:[ribosomal protein S18]-alanine N-acetyltransferase
MSAPHIRPGLPSDFVSIVALERATGTAPHWSPATYVAILSAAPGPQRCLIVAESAGSLVGFAVGSLQPEMSPAERIAELESVAVSASVRRAGIGRALCNAVLNWCRDHAATQVGLEVRATSAAAIALYTSLGFTEVGRRPRYYREPEDDAFVMRLDCAKAAL